MEDEEGGRERKQGMSREMQERGTRRDRKDRRGRLRGCELR